ncbi:MAG: tRNA modification GTPase [Planctomycetes bacterium]|nr:tRNA modification GTPase [Planctomycetota bacterium]
MHQVDDTIAAIASAPGGSLRGIVRVSGPETLAVIAKCFRARSGLELSRVKAAERVPGTLSLNDALGSIPCDVYLWPTDRSYTRQPTVEIHTIGSPPILEAIVHTLCKFNARLAQPGEFTMRAFLAGRLDLTQAEAVLGVIDATSQHDLDVALSQLAGGLAAPLHELRECLIDILAHLEAGLDFVEEDIEFIQRDELIQAIEEAATAVESVQKQLHSRLEVDEAPCVVLVGSPNVGKSSLLNALVANTAAIVSDVSGTTRDYVARRTTLVDRDVLLVDTAGVESPDSSVGISNEAQAMTRTRQQQAALLLFCLDATRPLNDWEVSELRRDSGPSRLVVWTKTDAGIHPHVNGAVIETSSVSGVGLPELRQAIYESIADDSRDGVACTALRCHESLRLARTSLEQARIAACDSLGEELVAAELRVVLEELGNVVGEVYTDDILERIFSRFCIGK